MMVAQQQHQNVDGGTTTGQGASLTIPLGQTICH